MSAFFIYFNVSLSHALVCWLWLSVTLAAAWCIGHATQKIKGVMSWADLQGWSQSCEQSYEGNYFWQHMILCDGNDGHCSLLSGMTRCFICAYLTFGKWCFLTPVHVLAPASCELPICDHANLLAKAETGCSNKLVLLFTPCLLVSYSWLHLSRDAVSACFIVTPPSHIYNRNHFLF